MASSKKLSDFFQAASGHRLLNAILMSPPKGIIIVDLDGNIMFANAPMNQAFSHYKQGLRNLCLYDFIVSEETGYIKRVAQLCREKGDTPVSLPTLELKHKDGQIDTYAVQAYGIYADSGDLECIEFNLDISQ